MVSIIIPARNEIFLQKTIDDLLKKAIGDIEILVGLDGYWPRPAIQDNKKVTIYHVSPAIGMRRMINNLVSISKGEYIMKIDAHCAVDTGFDEILKKDCEDNWVVVPRRYSLDPANWNIKCDDKTPRDAHFLSYPTALVKEKGFGMHTRVWEQRAIDRKDVIIDDEMTSQGSCYFMHRSHFIPLDDIGFGWFGQESTEVFVKTWLSGGRCIVNKNTWYAHLWKGNQYPREFVRPIVVGRKSRLHAIDLFFYEKHDLQYSFEWLIDKFWPVPSWPINWKEIKGEVQDMIDKSIDSQLEKTQDQQQPMPVVIETTTPIQDTKSYIINKFNLKEDNCIGIPNFTRDGMAKLFGELGFKIGAEVGSREGKFAETLCKSNPGVKLYCIDLWAPYDDYTCFTLYSDHEKNYNEAKGRLSKYNCELIKASSTEGAKQFKDESLDFVYIDANHKYEYVVADLAAWYPKVRRGGIISGHDYKRFYKQSPTIGVKQAVDGYCSAYQIYPYFIFQTRCADRNMPNRCGSFMWVKP